MWVKSGNCLLRLNFAFSKLFPSLRTCRMFTFFKGLFPPKLQKKYVGIFSAHVYLRTHFPLCRLSAARASSRRSNFPHCMGCIRDSYTLVLPEQQQSLIWWQKMLMLFGVVTNLPGRERERKSSLPVCLRLASSVFWLTSFPPLAAAQANRRIRITDTDRTV